MSATGPHRTSCGGFIDRERAIRFQFNGRALVGYTGDTLASALLANGVRTVARSFKFHRPRGIFSCGVEEPNALVQLHEGASSIPSARAPLVRLERDLRARSQAGWPSVCFDIGRVLDFVAPLWRAGFYNKTFIWPSWHVYEPVIRHLAGLGRVPTGSDPDRYDVQNLHCDLLVVGAGVAGLKAALDGANTGSSVVLVEQDAQLGGEAAWSGALIDERPPASWLEGAERMLRSSTNVRVLLRTTAVTHFDHQVMGLVEQVERLHGNVPRERYWIVRAKRIVLATGVIEQPLIFENNDRPGIMLAGGARQYLRRYAVAIGKRVLVATNNDSAYLLARDLSEAGVRVLGVADARANVPGAASQIAETCGVDVFPGTMPVRTHGFGALRSVVLGKLSPDSRSISSEETLECDALAVSAGFVPALHLYAQAGGKLTFDSSSGSLVPDVSHTDIARRCSMEIVGAAAEKIEVGARISPGGNAGRKWVDLLHDVTVADLELATRENYTAIEHIKRYTTVGMAADQGKTSTVGTLDVVGRLRGLAPFELGYTTMRPPCSPVTLGALAGRDRAEFFAPYRLLPLHRSHLAHHAVMQDFGEWRRPVAYLRPGETRADALRREARAVRTAAGLFDGSSLGKIEVHGPDALRFLDAFYINDLRTLQPHRVRYGLMLRESGVLFDDGTVVMFGQDRFLITTTTGNASRVAQWLEEWSQCEWPQLRVAVVPVTEQWATLSLAGPSARAIISKLATDIDFSPEAFPHLAMREGMLLGGPARIYRVSFTGELTYEINVSTGRAEEVWDALVREGEPEGLQPFGIDALQSLRLEKGFLHVGTDTDGTTIPDDVGWGGVAARKASHYIGKRSLALPANTRADRFQLVGLLRVRGNEFVVGSHLRVAGSDVETDGWITSAGIGTLTSEPIALAMVRGGRSKMGLEYDVFDGGSVVGAARLVAPPFYDRTGERMNV